MPGSTASWPRARLSRASRSNWKPASSPGPGGSRVVDGPFPEAKEAVGGFVKLLVSGRDEATAIARRHPGLEHGMLIEVREMTPALPPRRQHAAGRRVGLSMDPAADIPAPPADATPARLVEHFFRHETGRLHGALIRMMGVHNLALAEDVAQEAMLRALRTWAMGGIPPNPSAWIMRVAQNLARDALRHRRMSAGKESALITHHEQMAGTPATAWEAAQEIRDDTLRLLFTCCHPGVASDAQVMLASRCSAASAPRRSRARFSAARPPWRS